jgi:site-specific recombinase XerD
VVSFINSGVVSYLKKVLGQSRTKYNITRPKTAKTLPNVLTEEEVFKLINAALNMHFFNAAF